MPLPSIGPAIPVAPQGSRADGSKDAEPHNGDAALPNNSASRELLRPGMQLNGIFEIDGHLASGGMGEVYKGHSIQTGDVVAIKVIRAEFVEDETAISLFRKEAAALFHLHHEAIVRYFVFSIDSSSHRAYLAMEFVEGELLSQILKRSPVPLKDVCLLAERIALGLHAAHKRDIIHRDVTPDNIIIQNGDVREAKIIDFGIARWTQAGTETSIEVGFLGKYKYVSPEQLGLYGGDITVKSDIYSLGLVLLDALNGARTDMGATPLAVIEKRKTLPDLDLVDARIRPLLKKMLEPNPADRPESMLKVVEHIRNVPTSQKAYGASFVLKAVGTLALFGSGIFAYLWLAPSATSSLRLPEVARQPPVEGSVKQTAPASHIAPNVAYPIETTSAEAKAREAERLESLQREGLRQEVDRLGIQKRMDAERRSAEMREADRAAEQEARRVATQHEADRRGVERIAAERQERQRLIVERQNAIGGEAEELDAAIRELDRREVERLAAQKRREGGTNRGDQQVR